MTFPTRTSQPPPDVETNAAAGLDTLRPVTTRDLAWTRRAPITIRSVVTTAAEPTKVFDVLSRHEEFPAWFPGVKAARLLGDRNGLGAQRIVRIPGATIAEEFIAWDPGRHWAFTATAARPRFFRSLIEECVIEPSAHHNTLTYTVYVDPAPGLGWIVRLFAPLQRANIRRAMLNLAAIASNPTTASSPAADSSDTGELP